ncbi:MAG: surface lipoprotein assembly modifier [Pseudomonadota bacterium]
MSAPATSRALLLWATCLCLGLAQPALADKAVVAEDVTAQQLLALAARLLEDDKAQDADAILQQLRTRGAEEIERQFLLAQVVEKQFAPRKAIAILRAILVDQPTLTRVRLELGRLLFETKQYTAARYHFDLALSQAPSGAVSANVRQYLREIDLRRGWQAALEVRLVPDSNANAAPAAASVELFGLPFELSDEARAQSQFGLAVDASAGFRHQLNAKSRLNMRLSGGYVAYENSDFNDASLVFAPALERVLKRGILSVEPIVFARWFGGQRFNAGGGLTVSLRQRLSQKMSLLSFVSVRHTDYALSSLNSQTYQLGANVSRAFTSATFAQFGLTYTANQARDAFFSYHALGARFGIGREFSKGVTLNWQGDIRPALYRDVPSLFGRRRKDLFAQSTLSLTKRDWALWGFAPVFRYVYARNASSIDLYRYGRHRGELGFTRAF